MRGRLKTVADADLILVLRDGYVAEQGTHSELMAKRGVYWTMWEQQNAVVADVAAESEAPERERREAEVVEADVTAK